MTEIDPETRRIDVSEMASVETPALEENPRLMMIPIDLLRVETSFQRDMERRSILNVLAIARDFTWARFAPMIVSPVSLRDGSIVYSVIDGQHRAHAALLVGYDAVPAMVVPMSLKERARSFSAVNAQVTKVSGFHILKAAIAAGEDWALSMQRSVEKAECRLMLYPKSAKQKQPGDVFCISALKFALKQGGEGLVTQALRTVRQSKQGGNVYLYSAEVLRPWITAIHEVGPLADDLLIKFLDDTPMDLLMRDVARLRETPQYFRKSNAVLLERSIKALLKKYMQSETDAA